jgi:GNAT superfamily N-acetyltransferase
MAEAWFAGEERSLADSYPGGHPPEWLWMQSVEALQAHLAEPLGLRVRAWVGERDGRVLGFGLAGPAEGQDDATTVGALKSLYVRPDAWGCGVGSGLHAEMIAYLRRGFARADLWVIEGNARARAFYEHRGWQSAGEFRRAEAGLPLVRYTNPFE